MIFAINPPFARAGNGNAFQRLPSISHAPHY
jgi:hypothetical protein